MSRILTLAGLGLLAACLMLSAPSRSHAQGYDYGGYRGYRDGYSGYRGSYSGGYGGYGGYRGYSGGYGGYGRYGDHGGYSGYGGHGGYGGYRGRPIIVHPEYEHWTPRRGWHSHGHLHMPHRGHYHTVPY